MSVYQPSPMHPSYLCARNGAHLGILMQNNIACLWPSSTWTSVRFHQAPSMLDDYQHPGTCFKLVPEGRMGSSCAPDAQLSWTFFLCFLLKLYIIRRVWKSHWRREIISPAPWPVRLLCIIIYGNELATSNARGQIEREKAFWGFYHKTALCGTSGLF